MDTISREYQIRCRTPNEDEAVVRVAADVNGDFLPGILDSHPSSPDLKCTKIKIERHAGDPHLWTATAQWSPLCKTV